MPDLLIFLHTRYQNERWHSREGLERELRSASVLNYEKGHTNGNGKRDLHASSRFLPVNGPRQEAWWLVVRDEPVETFILGGNGGRILPIFSFREEAELFAHIEAGEGWFVWKMRTEGILQILCESSKLIDLICLDPLPSVVGKETFELVSLSRERFENLLLTEHFPVSDPRIGKK